MTNRGLIYRTLALWIILEIGIAAQLRDPSGTVLLVSWMRSVTAPPIAAATAVVEGVGDIASGFQDARILASENARLRIENDDLNSRNASLEADLEAALQSVEGLEALPRFSGTPARCLFRDLGRGLIIAARDEGGSVPVRHDDPVLGAGGVVGRVLRTEGPRCWIEVLTRPSAAVAVVTPDGSTHGLAEGTGGPLLEVQFVSYRAVLTVGQLLLTSGADGIYPPGLPVAEIASIQERGGPFLRISAKPVADPRSVQSLWILNPDAAQEDHP